MEATTAQSSNSIVPPPPSAATKSLPLTQEVPRRYVEQVQTTVETIRRRGIAIYDGVFHLANRSAQLIEKTREQVEPAMYDVRDFVVGAVNNSQPLDKKNRELRNNLLEMYIGITILSVGLSAGSMIGASLLGSFLSTFINPYIEFIALFAIPGYTFISVRKNTGIDETERRVLYFLLSYFIGVIFGHAFGVRLISTVPSNLFIPPLALALLIDYELGPRDLFADRHRLMVAAAGISFVSGYTLAHLITGFALAPILAVIATNAILWIHLQISLSLDKKSNISSTDLQFGYVVVTLVIHAIIAILFGNSQYGEPAAALQKE